MTVLLAVYAWAGLVFGSLSALVIGTFGILPFIVLPRGRREPYTSPAAALWAGSCLRFLQVRVEVTDGSNLDTHQGGMFICNHRSWVDPLLMIRYARAPGLSKALVFWIPFVGLYGWIVGSVFFNRGSATARTRARWETVWLLKQGRRIAVYPEGTRSRDGRLGERVYLTLLKDCFEAGVPVIPCAVWGTERVLPVNRAVAVPFQRCRFDIGKPMEPEQFPDADAFANACWREVVRRVDALRAAEESAAA
jgi:1-acyl-sn-glycerol-3-phosphate acyltransferase